MKKAKGKTLADLLRDKLHAAKEAEASVAVSVRQAEDAVVETGETYETKRSLVTFTMRDRRSRLIGKIGPLPEWLSDASYEQIEGCIFGIGYHLDAEIYRTTRTVLIECKRIGPPKV